MSLSFCSTLLMLCNPAYLSQAPEGSQQAVMEGGAADWALVSRDRESANFYDRASVQRNGEFVRFSFKARLARPDAGMQSMLMELDLDCERQTSAIRSARSFDARGRLIESKIATADEIKPEPILGGSSGEPLYKALCPNGRPLPAAPAPAIVFTPKG